MHKKGHKEVDEDKEELQETHFVIDDKNYATDEELAGRARQFLQKVSHEVRTNRGTLDQRYLQYYNIFRCVSDVRHYEGTSQVYIPQLRKNIESYVYRLKQALFPTDDILEVQPVDPEMADQSEAISTFIKWIIDKRVKIKIKIDRFLRMYSIFGWAVSKCVWEEEKKKIYGMEKVQVPVMELVHDDITGEDFEAPTGETTEEIREVEKTIIRRSNPTFIPVDNLAFYIYPVTCNDLEEAEGTIELTKQALWWLKARGKAGDYANTDQIVPGMADKTDLWAWAQDARLSTDGLSSTDKIPELPRYTLVEYWGKFNWGTDDDPDYKDTVITSLNNDIILQLRVNPYYDQEIPYLMGRMVELQNEAYPSGLMEPLAPLQYYLNDTYNQTFDALLYEINPIIKYDPGRIVNINSISFAPGAMWAVSDPDAVQFDRPPDVSQIGFFAASQATNLITAYPGMQEIPMTGRKAATHISAIQQEYSLPIISQAQNLEEQVMSPWVKKAYNRIQQFTTQEEKFMVTGKKGIKTWGTITPEMLVADYNFFWRGSNQATNMHVKAEQMIKFAEMTIPLIPALQMQGKNLDVGDLLQRIWHEGLGMDGEVIIDPKEDYSIDPGIENVLLSLGKFVPVSANDDDAGVHLPSHIEFMKNIHPEQAKGLNKHIMMHQYQAKQKQSMMMGAKGGQAASPQSEGAGQEGQDGSNVAEVPGQNILQGMQPENPGSP